MVSNSSVFKVTRLLRMLIVPLALTLLLFASVAQAASVSYTLSKGPLAEGANVIGWSLDVPAIRSASDLWRALTPSITGLFRWSPLQQANLAYDPAQPATDFLLFPGEGYVVVVNANTSLTVNGTEQSVTYAFHKQRNNTSLHLVSFTPSFLAAGVTSASRLASTITAADGISYWDSSSQQFVSYVPGVAANDFPLSARYGYFVSVGKDFLTSGGSGQDRYTYLSTGGCSWLQLPVGAPPLSQIQWFVDGLAGGSAASGVISSVGVYCASSNAVAGSRYLVEARDAQGGVIARYPVGVAQVSVAITPSARLVAPGDSYSFVAQVVAVPDVPELKRIEWLVDGVLGGSQQSGLVQPNGAFFAALQPSKRAVKIEARVTAIPSFSAYATVNIVGTLGPLTVRITPNPAAVPVRTAVNFVATVTDSTGALVKSAIRWYVNGTEHGSAKFGEVTNAGRYKAPLDFYTNLVTIKAVPEIDHSVSASHSFELAKLLVVPNIIDNSMFVNPPGSKIQLTVTSLRSGGAKKNVSRAVTTKVFTPNASVVYQDPYAVQKTLVMGDGAGLTMVQIEDQDPSLSGPAIAKAVVLNWPQWTPYANPTGTIYSVHPDERMSVKIGAMADRGVRKGAFTDSTMDSALVVQTDANGGVSDTYGKPPANAANLAAWWDRTTGEVVFGHQPGITTFAFREPLSSQWVTVTVQLIPLAIQVGKHVDKGVYFQSAPSMVFTPKPDQQPFGRWNNRALLNAWVYDQTGTLSPDQVAVLLQGSRVVMEDTYGTGLLLPGPVYFEPQTINVIAEVPGTDYYSYTAYFGRTNPSGGVLMSQFYHFVAPQLSSQGSRIELMPQLIPNKWLRKKPAAYPNGLIMASAEFILGKKGANSVRVSIPGTTASPRDAAITGILPSLRLREWYYSDTNPKLQLNGGTPTARPPGVYGMVATMPVAAGQGVVFPETAFGFELEMVASKGSAIARTERFGPKDEVVWAEPTFTPPTVPHTRFKAHLDQPGIWTLNVHAKGYNQDLATPVNINVEQENKGLVMTTVAGDAIAGPMLGPVSYQLAFYDEQGTLVVNPGGSQINRATVRVNTLSPTFVSGGTIDLYCHGGVKRGHVRLVLTDGSVTNGSWVPVVGRNTLAFSVNVIEPVEDGCYIPVSFFYSVPMPAGFVGLVPFDAVTGESNGITFETPDFAFAPGLAWMPISPYSSNVVRSFTLKGAKPLNTWNNGQPLQASQVQLETRDAKGNLVTAAWAPASLTSVDAYTANLQLTIDMYGLGFALGNYELVLKFPAFTKRFPLTLAALRLSGSRLGSSDPLLPIPLNAVWDLYADQWLWTFRQREVGLVPMEAHLEVGGGNVSTAIARLRVVSSQDSTTFKMAGFSRNCTQQSAGIACTVNNETLIYIPSQEPGKVLLYGNTTDIAGSPLSSGEIADGLPDVVSGAEGDVHFELLDTTSKVVIVANLATTTTFNFIARHKAMTYGEYDPTKYSNYEKAKDWLSSTWGDPYSDASNFSFSDRPPKSWDATPYIDGPRHYGFYRSVLYGILDMPWLMALDQVVNGAWQSHRVGRDGRAHPFVGLGPLGDPYADFIEISMPAGWKSFGLSLDGVCYDPGLAGVVGDVSPMSRSLYDLRHLPDRYPTKITGLLRDAGGTSGGLVGPDGGFILANRTPGVDFADVDCGYQVEGWPSSLIHPRVRWYLPGGIEVPIGTPLSTPRLMEIVYDDIEDVGNNGSSGYVQDASLNILGHSFHSYPRRVAMFARQYESKYQKIVTGMKIGGSNTAFEIVTNPLRVDGTSLLTARLNAGILLYQGASDPVLAGRVDSSQRDLIRLTARIDPAYYWYKPLSHLLVSGTLALVTGAIGAALTPGGLTLLHAALLNAGVSVVMQGSDDLHVNPVTGLVHYMMVSSSPQQFVGGAVLGSSASTAADKLVTKAIARGASQGAVSGVTQVTTDVVEVGLDEGASVFTKVLTEGGAFSLDVGGGILASVINDYLDVKFKKAYVGASHALVLEQTMLSVGAAPRAGADPFACGVDAPAGWVSKSLSRDLTKSRTVMNVGSADLNLDGTGAKLIKSNGARVKGIYKSMGLATEGRPYWNLQAGLWGGSVIAMRPGGVRTDYKSHAQIVTDDYRLCVGGKSATAIPYTHSIVTTTQRSVEESTASVVVDRSGRHRLLLSNIHIEAAQQP